jgi:uncharacterized protein (TIGR02217 family)
MSFLEIQFPSNISLGAVGGPEFSTDIVTVNSGYESRNIRWSSPRSRYDVSHAVRTLPELKELVSFFRLVKGRAHGFRFKDYGDYTTSLIEGQFGVVGLNQTPSAYAQGQKTYQLFKVYDFDINYTYRKIVKPVSGTFELRVDGVVNSNYTIDYTTGIVTFNDGAGTDVVVTNSSYSITGITRGATTLLNITGHTFSVGDRIYFSSIGGTTQLNGLYGSITSIVAGVSITVSINSSTFTAYTSGGAAFKHPITVEAIPTVHLPSHGLSANGYIYVKTNTHTWGTAINGLAHKVVSVVNSNVFTISTSTIGLPVFPGAQSVTFTKYFTPTTVLTWSGQFDVPCRFDTDYMNASVDSSIHGSWQSIPIIEIRI